MNTVNFLFRMGMPVFFFLIAFVGVFSRALIEEGYLVFYFIIFLVGIIGAIFYKKLIDLLKETFFALIIALGICVLVPYVSNIQYPNYKDEEIFFLLVIFISVSLWCSTVTIIWLLKLLAQYCCRYIKKF